MYHDYVMLCSHMGARTAALEEAFINHPHISVCPTPLTYETPENLITLKMACAYKPARVCLDFVLHNHAMRHQMFANLCRFVIFLDDPVRSISTLMNQSKYSPETVLDYYGFRLQRLSEIASVAERSHLMVGLEPEMLAGLSTFLRLSKSVKVGEVENVCSPVADHLAAEATRLYKKYLPRIQRHV